MSCIDLGGKADGDAGLNFTGWSIASLHRATPALHDAVYALTVDAALLE
jgi:hypothetical protein